MHNAIGWGGNHAVLDKMDTIFAGGNTLYLTNGSFVTDALEPHMTGVDERQYAVVVHRAAGKATVPIERIAGCQGNGFMLPVHQIVACHMSPMHGPPMFIVRIVLIKHMIEAVAVGETVGIVHPACRRREMISRVKTRFTLLFQLVLSLAGTLKRLVFYHGMHLSSLLNNGSAGESPGLDDKKCRR